MAAGQAALVSRTPFVEPADRDEPRTKEISRARRGNKGRARTETSGDARNAHTCRTRSVLGFLELIEVQGGFADGKRHGWRPTGKPEAVQNLPRRFRRVNCGHEPHDAAAPVAL